MYFIRCLIDIDDEEEEYEFLHKSSSSTSSSSNDASSLSLRDNVMKGSRMKEMKVYGDIGRK
jgi:hypothetical protein